MLRIENAKFPEDQNLWIKKEIKTDMRKPSSHAASVASIVIFCWLDKNVDFSKSKQRYEPN
jgi:hypothetical protein